ncbi:MAG: hypothetical protein QME92_11710 [Bacillota bacterium]|nr:hypothetical protein [Bacillota bacterium]
MDETRRVEQYVEQYIRGVLRHLYLKDEYRRRVADDLRSHIAEASQKKPVDEVLKDMGHPRKIAAEIMETYEKDYEKMGFLNAIAYAQHVRDSNVKSAAQVGGWPLVHIATGYNESGERNVAKGIIAVGDIAIGVVAMGAVSVGVIAVGALAAGVLASGALTVGLLVALGAAAASVVASVGGAAVSGGFAFGALALARLYAMGAYARALYYIGAYGESAVVPAWMRSLVEGLRTHALLFAVSLSVLGLALGLVPSVLPQLLALRKGGRGIR